MTEESWRVFQGTGEPHNGLTNLPPPPPWRRSSEQASPILPDRPPAYLEAERDRGRPLQLKMDVRRAINSALTLRRPLLVTGKPGVGKSSLASAVAYELRMGPVLQWSITSRSTVKSGLYEYDAVGRLHAGEGAHIGDFLRLGPLGSALYPTTWPRVLLIDEIDKGDIDLPNDLLNVLEDGHFEIPELARAKDPVIEVKLHESDERVPISGGRVVSRQFPFIAMTSNGEREFPPPFLRRCIRMTIPQPDDEELVRIVDSHLKQYLSAEVRDEMRQLVARFVTARQTQELATDQLLNAVFVVLGNGRFGREDGERQAVLDLLLKQLTTAQAT
jgi:MoxR-like ATPase